MTTQPTEILPDEVHIALAHTQPEMRGALRIFFELDRRLARIVAATTEPMLGQMRLAWWRDELGKLAADRPAGDVVLDGIGKYWGGREASLVKLVNAWEHLLVDPPLTEDDASAFGSLRRDALIAVYGDRSQQHDHYPAYAAAGWHWAMADFASNIPDGEERDLVLRLGQTGGVGAAALGRDARGLAILGALGLRALKRGGRPLMEGRTASLIATRAAIIGR